MTIEEAIKILEYPVKKWSMEWDEREDGLSYYEALDMAISALRQQEHFRDLTKKVEPLTLDDLRKMDGEPVWVICDKGFEPLGLWALVEVCEESIFLTNNLGGRTEYADDVELEDDGITVYRQKPEEGTV